MQRQENRNQSDRKLLPRDISRFETLYPNGEAQLKQDPTPGFSYLNSAEMVALSRV